MVIPAWLAGVLATALLGLLLTAIGWAIKSDRARAVESMQVQMEIQQLRAEVAKLGALLERHSPQAVQAEIDALKHTVQLQAQAHEKAMRSVRGRVTAHHGFIRDLQVRLAAAGIPESARTARLAQQLDEEPDDDA